MSMNDSHLIVLYGSNKIYCIMMCSYFSVIQGEKLPKYISVSKINIIYIGLCIFKMNWVWKYWHGSEFNLQGQRKPFFIQTYYHPTFQFWSNLTEKWSHTIKMTETIIINNKITIILQGQPFITYISRPGVGYTM